MRQHEIQNEISKLGPFLVTVWSYGKEIVEIHLQNTQNESCHSRKFARYGNATLTELILEWVEQVVIPSEDAREAD